MKASPDGCPSCGAAAGRVLRGGLCVACALGDALSDAGGAEHGALGRLGGLELLEEIGRGGMGVVYRALQREPHREVALKALPAGPAVGTAARERFRIEAQAMSMLEHPRILPIFEFGEEDGTPFFTMKLVTGGSLAERIGGYSGKWAAIADLIAQVAEAVQFAHDRGVLHRDLKPGNILFDDEGRPFVADFGLAKLADEGRDITRTMALMGTPHYMAPELADRDARGVTTASDVWSLGAILYEVLAGRQPFAGDSIPVVLRQVAEEDPPPLPASVPRDLRVIAFKALTKDPAQRYHGPGALAEDLRRWQRGEPIQARPVAALERVILWAKRKPAMAALTALVFLSLSAAIILLVKARSEAVERLRVSLVAQAHAMRERGLPGQRAAALEVLRQAARISPGDRIRDEFITTLALPDYAEHTRIPWRKGTIPPILSPVFDRFAVVENGVVFLQTRDGRRSPLPSPGKPVESAGPFSPDGTLLAVHTDSLSFVRNISSGTWLRLGPSENGVPRGFEEHFSPDGKWLARTPSPDRTGGVELISLTIPPQPPRHWTTPWPRLRLFGFSPDSTQLAAGGFTAREAIVADALTGRVLRTLRHPESARVRCGSWRRDGRMLAVGTENFKVYLWRLADEAVPPQLLGHTGNVVAVDWSPDGSRIVTASMDATTRLWDVSRAATLAEWPWTGHRVACSVSGEEFAAWDSGGAATVISRLREPDVCRELHIPHPDLDEKGTAGSWCAVFSPDGSHVLAGDTLGVYLFNAATGEPSGHQPADYCWSIAFPGTDSFCGCTRKGIYQWPMPGRTSPLPADTRLVPDDANMMAAARDSGLLVAASDNNLLLFKNGVAAAPIAAPHALDTVAVNASGTKVACGHQKTPGITVWDVSRPAQPPQILEAPNSEVSVAWTHDGALLLAGDWQNVRAFTETGLREQWRIPRRSRSASPAVLTTAPATDLAAAAIDPGVITLLRPSTGRVLVRLEHPRPREIRSIAISPDGSRLAAMTLGHVVQLWDLKMLRAELAAEGLGWE